MTTTVVYADSADGYLRCAEALYANVVAGTGTITTDSAETSVYWGQSLVPGVSCYAWEAFHSFTYSPDATQRITGAYFRFTSVAHDNTAVSRSMDVAEYDWGGTVGSGDWRTSAQLAALTVLTAVADAQAAGTNKVRQGSDLLVARLAGASPLRTVTYSNRYAGAITPSVSELSSYRSADYAGTADDPAVVYTSVPLSTHLPCAGGQVQLSDGSWAYLESSGAAAPTVALKRCTTGAVVSTIASVPVGTSSTDFSVAAPGGQLGMTLVVDSSDNLYVIGAQGSNTAALAALAYVKGGGANWAAGVFRAAALPSYPWAGVNGVAAAWHNTGTGGTLAVLAARGVGWWSSSPTQDLQYALVDCQYLLDGGGSGALLRGSGSAVGLLVPSTGLSGEFALPTNETGTGLDVAAAPEDPLRGYTVTFNRSVGLGSNHATTACRYLLASGGASISNALIISSGWAIKDAATKARVLTPGAGVLIAVTADTDTLWGLSVAIRQNSGTSSEYTNLAYVTLDNQSIASMPPAATIAAGSAWDAHYDPVDNRLWIYYVDTANVRRVVRTAVDLNTYLATREEIEVAASVGSAGSTVTSIRTARGYATGNSVLVHLALSTSGVQSAQLVVDSLNKAPTQPTLTPKANFDATAAAAFAWTFTDPNAGDTQSAFQLDINTAAGVDVYDTGKMGAAVSFVATGTKATGNNASVVPAMPAGWAPGDLLLILASIRNSGTGTVTAPSGWTALATSGNVSLLGRIARTGDTAPTVTFANGAANADTLAQMIAFRGTDQNIATVVHASQVQLNSSAANVAYPAATITAPGCAVLYCGWKQDDWTSVATIASATEISDDCYSTAGDDAAQCWDYVIQTAAANIGAGSFTVTGGASAISRGLVVALQPYQAPTTASFTLPASTISNGASYQWRVRTYDAAGAVSPWSNYSTFQTSASGTATVTDPASDNPAGVITDHYTVTWSVAGTTQAAYRVVVTRTDTSAVLVNTGWVTSAATSYLVDGMLSDVEYQVAVTVRNAGLVESGTGTRLITPSYAAPDLPTVTLTAYDGDLQPAPYLGGYIEVAVSNPSPSGDRPVPASNLVRRRVYGESAWVDIASIAEDATYRDYTAASGITYEYVVRAVATDGSYTESATATTSLLLRGVWIHDPLDPTGTVTRLLFGQIRDAGIGVPAATRLYAGRTYPVADWGTGQTGSYRVAGSVPFGVDEYGGDWATTLAAMQGLSVARRALCIRDGRGRSTFGLLSDYQETNTTAGTDVGFSVQAIDYSEGV